MCQTRDGLILSYVEFFHITNRDVIANIQEEGLLPQQTDPLTPESRKLICVAPFPQTKRWRDQMYNGLVVLRIAAENIITKAYGIDHTFAGWEVAAVMEEVAGLRHMIEHNGTLAVFDRIPPEEFTVWWRENKTVKGVR